MQIAQNPFFTRQIAVWSNRTRFVIIPLKNNKIINAEIKNGNCCVTYKIIQKVLDRLSCVQLNHPNLSASVLPFRRPVVLSIV